MSILYLYSPILLHTGTSWPPTVSRLDQSSIRRTCRQGEFGIEDPDGYCILVGQTDEVSF